MTEIVQNVGGAAVLGSIVVVGALTRCSSLHLVCDLKTALMGMQRILIRELMPYECELGHDATEATQNICWAKGDGTVDRRTVTKWSDKFHLGCKNLDDQARLKSKAKTVDLRGCSPFH